MHGTQRSDRIVAIPIAILLTAGYIVVLSPFVSALLWAVLLCCVTWPTWLAVEPAAHALGMNSVFVGSFVVAILGNAAEHATAVTAALGNRMERSLGIAVGRACRSPCCHARAGAGQPRIWPPAHGPGLRPWPGADGVLCRPGAGAGVG